MRRYRGFDLLRRHRDIHIHLFERPDLVVSPIRQKFDGAHHPRSRREQEQAWVLTAFGRRHEPDLQV